MFGLVVMEVMTLSGHPLIINKINVYTSKKNLMFAQKCVAIFYHLS